MSLNPDITQAAWEFGSALFCLMDVRAIRKAKVLAGAHWFPKLYFGLWGLYNLWFYEALHLPAAWWAGLAITAVNIVWLGHVAFYGLRRRRFIAALASYLESIGNIPF